MAFSLNLSRFDTEGIAIPACELAPAYRMSGSKFPPDLHEVDTYFEVLERSILVRTHRDLLDWLQGELQFSLPHNILVAAWGDFELGTMSYDAVSSIPGVRTGCLDDQQTRRLLMRLFDEWRSCDRSPVAVSTSDSLRTLIGSDYFRSELGALCATEAVLVHGIRDRRSCQDCLYVLFGGDSLHDIKSRHALTFLLPYIDNAFRRISHLTVEQFPDTRTPEAATEEAADTSSFDLSQREKEILRWVGRGKTNYEIGIILDVSTFTVKNHLQRTFRKLDVMNRAQAVAKLQAGPIPR